MVREQGGKRASESSSGRRRYNKFGDDRKVDLVRLRASSSGQRAVCVFGGFFETARGLANGARLGGLGGGHTGGLLGQPAAAGWGAALIDRQAPGRVGSRAKRQFPQSTGQPGASAPSPATGEGGTDRLVLQCELV